MILLHREDVYEKESTRPGEADLIVAKHRNGPTRDLDRRLPGPLLPLRGHGPRLTPTVVRWGAVLGVGQSAECAA